MPTFSELRNDSMRIVDEVFSENIRLAFFTSAGTADPTRPQRLIKGILRVGQGKTINLGEGSGGSWSTRIYTGAAELFIDPVAWPGLVIKSKDAVRAMDRPGQPFFTVSAVDTRDTRITLKLGAG